MPPSRAKLKLSLSPVITRGLSMWPNCKTAWSLLCTQQQKLSFGTMVPSSPSPSLLLLRSTKIYLSIPFLSRSHSSQILFRTIFSTEPDKDNNDGGPLNRLMSLYVFPPKFTKGHLNAVFQSNDLELAAIYNLPLSTLFTMPRSWTKFWSPWQRRKLTKSETRRVLQLPKATIRKFLHSSRELEKSIPWTTSQRRVPIFVECNLPSSTSPRAIPSSASMPGR